MFCHVRVWWECLDVRIRMTRSELHRQGARFHEAGKGFANGLSPSFIGEELSDREAIEIARREIVVGRFGENLFVAGDCRGYVLLRVASSLRRRSPFWC